MAQIVLSEKQSEAMDILEDKETIELLYGGAAGGGKSVLGCVFITKMSLQYPGTRYLLGRAVLKNLKESTLLTLFDVFKILGLKTETHYKYNSMAGIITFWNGSEIYLKDLFLYPSDAEFDSLGSTEYTGAFIDECSQVTRKAKNIVVSRLRYKTLENGITPKCLLGTNPTKNFAYDEYYKPAIKGELLPHRKFVAALPTDNPFLDPAYIQRLNLLDEKSKQRLRYGNWEYDDDPTKLIPYDKIVDMFTNAKQPFTQKYLSCDIARMGEDKCVVWVWEGLYVVDVLVFGKSTTKETRLKLEAVAAARQIPRSNIIVDEDGVGGGVKDEMTGIKGFINNSSAIQPLREGQIYNYTNLKSQCYYKLADYINTGQIGIYPGIPIEVKEKLIADLEQVKTHNADKDGKLAILPKDKVKEFLGRSPDFSDALMLRMFFEVRQYVTPGIASARVF